MADDDKKIKKIEKARLNKTPVYCFVTGCHRFEGVYMKSENPDRHSWKCSHCKAIEKRDKESFKRHRTIYLEHVEELESPICFHCGNENEKCACHGCANCRARTRAACRCGQYSRGSRRDGVAGTNGIPDMPPRLEGYPREKRQIESEHNDEIGRIEYDLTNDRGSINSDLRSGLKKIHELDSSVLVTLPPTSTKADQIEQYKRQLLGKES